MGVNICTAAARVVGQVAAWVASYGVVLRSYQEGVKFGVVEKGGGTMAYEARAWQGGGPLHDWA